MVCSIFSKINSIAIDYKTKAMNFKNITFCFIVLTSCFTYLEVNGQQSSPRFDKLSLSLAKVSNFSIQENQKDSLITWQERLLLHVDKPIIEKGRPLFFKAYTLTGPNRVRGTLSKVVKLELLNSANEILSVQHHKIEDGMAQGEFKIPEKLDKGIYKLRAYTRWMQNYGPSFYYEQKLILGSDIRNDRNDNTENFNVTFYPEGGNLVAGVKNKLLLRAKNKKGQLVKVEGDIINKLGIKIAPVVVFENRIMSTIFKPEFGQEYHFVPIDQSQKTFVLPALMEEGYSLSVNNLDKNVLSVGLEASEKMIGKEVWLKGEMSGVTYFDKQINFKKPFTTLEIAKEGIPFGILTISLVDENNRVWSKRPVSISPANDFNLVITPLKNDFEDELSFTVRLTNEIGEPVETDFSLSVTSMYPVVNRKPGRQNVDFLWEQNISGGTNQNQARVQTFMKDLELLTSEDSQAFQDIPNRIQYPFQKGLDLFGYAYDLNNKLLKRTKIQMLITSDSKVIVKELFTDVKGRIRLEGLDLYGNNELVFRAAGDDTSSRLVKLVPIQENYDTGSNPKPVLAFANHKKQETIQTSPWEAVNNEDLIALDEVYLVEKKKEERKRATKATYGLKANFLRSVIQDIKRPKSMLQLLQSIPGVVATGDLDYPLVGTPNRTTGGAALSEAPPNAQSSVLNQSGPLWVIDGFIWGNWPGVDPAMGLTMLDIDRIEFLNSSDISMYCSRGTNGVFMIYTRNGSELEYINRKKLV